MAISFAKDIKPLFRPKDIACMKPHGVELDSFEYMSDPKENPSHPDHGNVRDVLDRLSGRILPRMPMGAPPWPDTQIKLLESWIKEGCLP